jgi:hypothetical protein
MKTIINKKTKEFCKYYNGYVYTSTIPAIISGDASMEDLIRVANIYDNVLAGEVDWDLYEIVEVDVVIKK